MPSTNKVPGTKKTTKQASSPKDSTTKAQSAKAASPEKLPVELCRLIDDRGGTEISLLDVGTLSGYTDYLIIATGRSQTVVKTLAEYVEKFADENHMTIVGTEGKDAPDWIIVDIGDIVVHLFTPESRQYYNLDKLWMDAREIPIVAQSG